jgi:CubicO group peptidase (beta-lactamase class C family)
VIKDVRYPLLMTRTSSRLVMALALVAAASVSACSGATDAAVASPAPATTPSPAIEPQPEAEPHPEPRSAACVAEDAALQNGLDKAHAKDTDAVLAVRNPACGARVLTSGPSKNDPTRLHRIGSVTKTYVAAVIPEKKTTLVAIVDSDAENPNDVSLEALKVLF